MIHTVTPPRPLVSRRMFVASGACCALAGGAPPAQAFVSTLLGGINALVTLWSGYQMAGQLYERYFDPEKRARIDREQRRLFETPTPPRPEHYGFDNPYKFREFGSREPGCVTTHQAHPQFRSIISSSTNDETAITTGFIIALAYAVEALRSRYAEDNVAAYTRPSRLVQRAEPWSRYDMSRGSVKSDMYFHAPAGAIGLQWAIPDPKTGQSQGSFIVRDNHSGVVVAEGATPMFRYGP